MTEICSIHNIEKSLRIRNYNVNGKSYVYEIYTCAQCKKEYNENYNKINSENISEQKKQYYKENKKQCNEKDKKWREENKEYNKVRKEKWVDENREKVKANAREKSKEKRKNDPFYRFMSTVSRMIFAMLTKSGFQKPEKSFRHKLTFTKEQFIDHFENLFSHPDNLTPDGKVWMNWNNQGKYIKKKWNDLDPITWVWQMDHIKPHSDYPYDDYDHPNFIVVWNLNNLRPLSAKKNHNDGVKKIRHKTTKKKKE